MSDKYYVDNIEDATRGYDTNTNQYVYIEEIISDRFCICQPYDNDTYIICNICELRDLHYM